MNDKNTNHQDAIHALFKRMDGIAEQCGDRFPLFRADKSTQWTLSRRGSWLGGFWAGLWWLRAAYYGKQNDLDIARTWSARLESSLSEASVNRSFVFWYGAASNRACNTGNAIRQLATRAAQAIAVDFDPSMEAWPVGPGMGVGGAGVHRINVDALAPTLALLHGYGDADGATKANRHLQTCLRHLTTDHGAWRTNAIRNADGTISRDEAGVWPRGQAWGMLGMAEAVRLYGPSYRNAALQACNYWMQRWGRDQDTENTPPKILNDPSAHAIAAVAMLRLYPLVPDQHWLLRQSHAQIASILCSSKIAETGQFVGHLYHTGADGEQLVESACATFFLLEALLSMHGNT
ncbi:hypothetical protein ACNQFN_09190 [Thauera butanivorans]|uniref:hypothetical protein n=1 Tax=Thauera butanivorans TaxID=86174 RepID=UPI003AB2336A